MAAIKNVYPLVYIEWCDAITHGDGWIPLHKAIEWGECEDWIIKQSGFILKETKEFILLASKVNPHVDNEYPVVDGITKIPKTWIRKRKNYHSK